MLDIRPCRDEHDAILDVINAAAEAYRGVILADRWHDPYFSQETLQCEIAAGVRFWACEADGVLAGVMGLQSVRDVELIRHAYVLPRFQRCGIGAALLRHLKERSTRRMLVGTWAAAHWAIAFYRRHGFEAVSEAKARRLLMSYWSIPERQVATSVVLVNTGPKAAAAP